MEETLVMISKAMLDYAQANSFQDDFSKFERVHRNGLRLRCYMFAGKLTLDVECRYREIGVGELETVRMAFRATRRSIQIQKIDFGNSWRGIRLVWDPNETHEDEIVSKQGQLF
jgi:hypothetical protein